MIAEDTGAKTLNCNRKERKEHKELEYLFTQNVNAKSIIAGSVSKSVEQNEVAPYQPPPNGHLLSSGMCRSSV